MNTAREPWLGILTVAGLVVMLLWEGWYDALGLALAATPLGWGVYSWWRASR